MKPIKTIAGAALAVAVLAVSGNAFSELQLQVQPEAQIVAKESGIINVLAFETVKSISVPAEGAYTCKGGAPAVEIGEAGRILLGGGVGSSFLLTLSSGRKVIVYAPAEASFKAAMAVAIESQLAGLNVTFRNNGSEAQDAYFKGACDGVDKVSIANEITITKN
jgi:hypothetical protein